ncbi:hypothetical protein PV703_10545 [Streptomyces sp. ME01-24h]|nr:hypothetical protein [Streptomyces sp. ME01-24h]
MSRLPAPSLRLLLLATLEGRGDLGVMLAAAGRQDGTMDLDALAPAERDDLIDIDHCNGRLIFRHPLIRSGVVAASTSADRRSAHQALAASERRGVVVAGRPLRRRGHPLRRARSRNTARDRPLL